MDRAGAERGSVGRAADMVMVAGGTRSVSSARPALSYRLAPAEGVHRDRITSASITGEHRNVMWTDSRSRRRETDADLQEGFR